MMSKKKGTKREIFALLLPVTSRGLSKLVWSQLESLQSSLRNTISGDGFIYHVYVAIDSPDEELVQNQGRIQNLFVELGMKISILVFKDVAPGSICYLWSKLASRALEDQCDYYILLGDDVELITPNWPKVIQEGFLEFHQTTGRPLGFGCIAFTDRSFPGFPTFPVLHRTHFEVLGRIFPENAFVNQDADPYVFEIYCRFKCAKILPNLELCNKIGGAKPSRYEKQRKLEWNRELLRSSVLEASNWLRSQNCTSYQPALSIDVIVPSFRGDEQVLERILSLPVPDSVCTRFILIFDNPKLIEDDENGVIKRLETKYRSNAQVRIRTNQKNLGASASRNKGLNESNAEFVIFLDDDVHPTEDLIGEYAKKIREFPNAAGYVGRTVLPPPKTVRQKAIKESGICYFYDIAQESPEHDLLCWGVTANLCVRRELAQDVKFRPDTFPKTGGGEDLDFCARYLQVWGGNWKNHPTMKFKSTPKAVVYHPWWDGGNCYFEHFFKWSTGDCHLVFLHPNLSYLSFPNFPETLILFLPLVIGRTRRLKPALQLAVVLSLVEIGCRCLEQKMDLRVAILAELITWIMDFGKMLGNFKAGRGLRGLFWRYDWFQSVWPEWRQVERIRSLKRTLLRLSTLIVLIVPS